jgi:catechol 2,3-dioxygenase-like lactoylglutathione lyase family enzyme
MLASTEMVGFLLTKDYDKARAFYEGNLGFEFVSLDQFALVMQAGKSMIRIVKDPTFTPLRSTVLGWQVDNMQPEPDTDSVSRRGGRFGDNQRDVVVLFVRQFPPTSATTFWTRDWLDWARWLRIDTPPIAGRSLCH